jgi:SAM-dependent methyltransferase
MRASPSPTPDGARASLPASYWDQVSDQLHGHYYHDAVIGDVKRGAHLRLVARWCGDLRGKTVLKTDLFEEAHGPDQFLLELNVGEGLRLGLDISPRIVRRAREVALGRGFPACRVVAGDLLALPLRAACLDIVVSNSTLDHFADPLAIAAGLQELYRALRPGGILVVTLDNPRSLSYAVGRVKRLLRPDPFYMGRTLSVRELRAMLTRLGYRVTDTTAIMHGMENHSSAVMHGLGRLGGRRLQNAMGALLGLAERLEAVPTRYLTGAFIAARAVKPDELPARG